MPAILSKQNMRPICRQHTVDLPFLCNPIRIISIAGRKIWIEYPSHSRAAWSMNDENTADER